MKKLITTNYLLLLILVVSGCAMLTRSPAEKSTDPAVIKAVAHANAEQARAADTSRLVWMGGMALIAGVSIRFASNAFLPKSTGIGIGIAVGGAGCLAIARFDSSLQRVALPAIIIIMALAIVWIAIRLYTHTTKHLKKKNGEEVI